jgi:hypothetical protein
MDAHWYGLIELVFVFGVFLAFYIWQMRDLKKRADARAAGKDPDAKS